METTSGMRAGSEPVACRNSRSLRQWPKRETMTSTGIRVSASWICHCMWKDAPVAAKPLHSALRSTPGSSARKCTRMKKTPVSGSPYCWLSTIEQPVTSRKLATACTMPRWSGHVSVRI